MVQVHAPGQLGRKGRNQSAQPAIELAVVYHEFVDVIREPIPCDAINKVVIFIKKCWSAETFRTCFNFRPDV